MRWQLTDKSDSRCRELADRHYTRIAIGHPMWTRPGYNMILIAEHINKYALFCWWRPKWESNLIGTKRKDGLYCIECTMFRNETNLLSSLLIVEAVSCLQTWEHYIDCQIPDGIITGVNSAKTSKRRSRYSSPGSCFRWAGFQEFQHSKSRADIWLKFVGTLPNPEFPLNPWEALLL